MFGICRTSRFSSKLKWAAQISTSSNLNCDSSKSGDRKRRTKDRETRKVTANQNVSGVASEKTELFTTSVNKEEKQIVKEKLKKLLLEADTVNNKIVEAEPIKVVQTKRLRKPRAALLAQSFEKTITKYVQKVANEFGGNTTETESELLTSLKKQKIIGVPQLKPEDVPLAVKPKKIKPVSKEVSEKMSKIILEMDKIEVQSIHDHDSTLPFTLQNCLFSKKDPEEVRLKFWEELEEKELKFLTKQPPRNYFEELILWTEQGKLWHFPIDNDQGREDEAQVDFTEHVFLEEYLEPWCPSAGPIRHFMDLVLVGLSKNPYLTVEDKKDHIFWYRDYFESKKKLLMELGAFASKKEVKGLIEDKQEV